jgi:site-specific DNA recombinase
VETGKYINSIRVLQVVSGSKRAGRLRARSKVGADARAVVATRAVAYGRVSTDEQAESGHGLETQDRAVHAFADSQGYELVEIASDPGIPGATRPADRPCIGRVLELAAAGAFTALLVYRFDRLTREIRYAVTTESDLAEQHEVVIRSVTEPIDTATAMGRTLFAILAGWPRTMPGSRSARMSAALRSSTAPPPWSATATTHPAG